MNLKEKLLLTVPEFDFREYQNEDDFIVVCFFALFTANNMHSTLSWSIVLTALLLYTTISTPTMMLCWTRLR